VAIAVSITLTAYAVARMSSTVVYAFLQLERELNLVVLLVVKLSYSSVYHAYDSADVNFSIRGSCLLVEGGTAANMCV